MVIKRLFLLVAPFLLWACAATPEKPPGAARFCDSFFIYVMCAEDVTGDGRTDIMFFEDDKQVFMYQPGAEEFVSGELTMHRCAMVMDDVTQDITSDMIAMDDDTPLMEELSLKRRLLSRYGQRRKEMDDCNARYDNPSETAPSESGFSDYPEDDLS